jgi:hypothetical protein
MESHNHKGLQDLEATLGKPKYYVDAPDKIPGESYYWFPNQGNSMTDDTGGSIPAGSLVLGRLLSINNIQDVPLHRPAVFIIDYAGEQYCLLKNACGIKNDNKPETAPSSPLLCLHSNNPGPGFEDLWVPFQNIKYIFVVERVRRPNGTEFVPVPDK